ncbi:hypothetical protein Tco_1533925 [Tanacetum coccineum]
MVSLRSQTFGSGDGTDFESRVPDEQQRKIFGTDKGTGTKLEVPDVPKYDSESEKESWGDSGEEDDDDEDDTEDESDNDSNDDDGNNDDNDDDSDHERTESNRDEYPNLNQSNEEHEEEKEYVDERVHTPENYELTDEEDNADNAKEENEEEKDDAEELYKDVNVEEDAHVTLTVVHDTQKTEGPMQSSSVSSNFIDKLLNIENTSPADNEIASLMDTTVRHKKPSSQTSSLFTVPITVTPESTSAFTITIPPPPPSFNPLPQQATPTPTPTASKVTTLFPALPDFSSVFRFNKRVTNLEKDLSEMKQVDQYAQAISLISAIVDRYIGNKQGEAIQQAIKSHTSQCREEALAEKREYIDLFDTSQNVTEPLKAVVLAKSSSQPKFTYKAVASLSEFELTKILMHKIEEHKSYLRVDYKRELYDALVKSYNTDKDLFETYGEVFTLKRSQDDKDKDQDPFAGSD